MRTKFTRRLALLAVITVSAVTVAGTAAQATPRTADVAAASSGYTPPSGVIDPCPPAAPGDAGCAALISEPTATSEARSAAVEASTSTPSGYSPADLRAAYDLQTGYAGSLQTVAVVTAWNYADAASDLAAYRSEYGLTPCTVANNCFEQVSQTGSTTDLPPTAAGWDAPVAESLDMISAVCPNCHILLVEASSGGISDLGTAENEAVSLGAKFVDNDWFIPETQVGSEETTYDTDYFNHPGVAITAPGSDEGYGAISYPAASQYVTAVGGTTLTADTSTARGYVETAWAGSSSGCSAYEPKPSWQTDTGCADRSLNDIAADADPNTPVAYYDTPTEAGWGTGSGTVVAAAIIAATYALAGTPAAGTYPAEYPYEYPGGDYTTPGNAYPYIDGLYNITSGSDGTCSVSYECTAGDGYNGPTGLGSPASVMSFSSTGGETGSFYRGTDDLCMDDSNSDNTDGNVVQAYDCNGSTAQNWTAEADGTIQHDGTSYCLTVAGGGTASGTLIELDSCTAGDASQQWIPLGPSRDLYNPQSGLCANDAVATEGTQLELSSCYQGNNEIWDLPYSDPTATGEITSQIKAGECLDNYLGAETNNNKVDIWTCNGGTDSQEWTVEADGTVQVAGGCLAVAAGATANGSLVEWYPCNGTSNQDWIYRSDGTLYNRNSGTCLDDPDADTTDGTQEQIYTCNGNIQQSWNAP
jgi:hypothetical protein